MKEKWRKRHNNIFLIAARKSGRYFFCTFLGLLLA
nr:MAG TPA: hypothetical protein [Caudoviricetes sp.]